MRDDHTEFGMAHMTETDAQSVLPIEVYRYFKYGAGSGETSAANRQALDRLRLQTRVLVDHLSVTTDVELLNSAVSAPLIVAPMAAQCLAHPDGELAVAHAVSNVGGVMILSMSSTTAVEEVAGIRDLPVWFQVYPLASLSDTKKLVERALEAGCRALVLTVDVPPAPRSMSPHRQLSKAIQPTYPHHGAEPALLDRMDWAYVEGFVRDSPAPVVIKGVLHPDDAMRAGAIGAAGIVVSNHGGRIHDGLIAVADALPSVAEAVEEAFPDLEVYADGSITSGIDILRVLALGAGAAIIGRPVLWALTGGSRSVESYLTLVRDQFQLALTASGAAHPSDLASSHIRRAI